MKESFVLLLIFIWPLLFLTGLLCLPKGLEHLVTKADKNDSIKALIKEAQAEEIEILSKPLAKAAKDHISYQLDKLRSSIDYAVGRHDWYETQRAGILNGILTISGLLVAAMALTGVGESVGANTISEHRKLMILSLLITTAIAVVTAVLQFNAQLVKDRPYRLISDIRFWFFRYVLSGRSSELGREPDYEKIAIAELAQRRRYLGLLAENLSLNSSIREDFEQLYILHVLQRYKHESVLRLRSLHTYFVVILTLQILFYSVWILFF